MDYELVRHVQMQLYQGWFRNICEVVSIDGNYHQMKATKFCEHWRGGKWIADGRTTAHDAPAAAFAQSCQNIMEAWQCILQWQSMSSRS